jgi:hypothetical protein
MRGGGRGGSFLFLSLPRFQRAQVQPSTIFSRFVSLTFEHNFARAPRHTPPHTATMEAYKLHPLVLVNVSDHYTRMKAQLGAGEEPDRVLGCLLGFQTGNREVEICNSFEVKYQARVGLSLPGVRLATWTIPAVTWTTLPVISCTR